MNASDLARLLRERYAGPSWAYLEEVANGTGFSARRRADAVALSLYPSRGILLHGFEIKVSRGDVTVELDTPQKAESIARYCDFWWLVVADEDLIEGKHVPDTWGILAPRKKGLHQVRKAAQNGAREAWSSTFVAAVFRRFSEAAISMTAHRAVIADLNAKVDQMAKTESERLVTVERTRADRAEARAAEVERQLAAFEKESGVSVRGVPYLERERIARAVHTLVDLERATAVAAGFHNVVAHLKAAEAESAHLRGAVERSISEIDALLKGTGDGTR